MHLPGPLSQLGVQTPGPVLARRALLPLPLLLLTGLPLRTPAADTFEFNGKAGMTELEVRAYADTYVPGPPYCTYGLRVPASCVLYVPEAQGSLPRKGGAPLYCIAVVPPSSRCVRRCHGGLEQRRALVRVYTLQRVGGHLSDTLGLALQVRAQMTKKLEAAALSGKGIDVDKRGQFNEKALFSEDFYFKFGLRPTPEDLKNKPVEDLPFAPIQRRYTGYKKYEVSPGPQPSPYP